MKKPRKVLLKRKLRGDKKKANEALCKVRMSSNERKKDGKVRSKTEYRTYGEQRLAKAGVACS